MIEFKTHEHDVLVIGAGGAGLRAAIEAAAAGVSVGVVCKSLLGKAHTVMAEGGMAAALGNVDDRDSWKTHFADTMRDGQSIAYHAGAELMDAEFVQFHPTGMMWPPSVRGILVTEGVRGEGGVLLNSEGKRFMFEDIPDNYKPQTAADPEEGWRYVTGDKNARRPPELLTRDHVARCIRREVKAGRGSPHGGVFLDIAWIKERIPKAAEHIKKKLPSMYHQFKQLADLDITTEPMEVGPTTHYTMGGVRVDSDSQMSTTVPGLFAAGEVGAGLHGANRLGGNSLSDLLVFGRRAGEYAAKFAKDNKAGTVNDAELDALSKLTVAPFERDAKASPYAVQYELQEMMQDLVGIVRVESEMKQALEGIAKLKARAAAVGVTSHREWNPGWHTALDLDSLLTISEAITLAAIERKESRGGHFRDDFPEKSPEYAKFNIVLKKGSDGQMVLRREPVIPMRSDLQEIITAEAK